jgi:hypothetical protein
MALFDTIEAIENAIVQRLIDTDIDGVLGIVFNREIRQGDIKNPYIRVFPDPSAINDAGICTIKEDWVFSFTIMAVAASYDSKDYNEAREIALKAASAMYYDPIAAQVDRHLTIGGTPYVADIVRTIWHAEYTKELPDEMLFGAAVEFEARKILEEV